MTNKKNVYLIAGYSNLRCDEIPSPDEVIPPCKIIVSTKQIQEASSVFSRFLLYKLAVIPFEEAKLRVLVKSGVEVCGISTNDKYREATPSDLKNKKIEPAPNDEDFIQYEDVQVLNGHFTGLNLYFENEPSMKYLGVKSEMRMPGGLEIISDIDVRPSNIDSCDGRLIKNPFAVVPGQGEFLTGNDALQRIREGEYRAFSPLLEEIMNSI